MREILFRGKDESGKWAYGRLAYDVMSLGAPDAIVDKDGITVIDPDTVGQYTGVCDKHGVYIGRYKPFKPVIEAEWVLEVLQHDAYDVAGDAAGGWLDNLTPAEVELLGERLTRVFRRWARECGEEPDFGEVNHIKRYDLRTGRKV